MTEASSQALAGGTSRMPAIIYIFALCAFALGFTEFVTIGLVAEMAVELNVGVGLVGMSVAAYALGATIGAPLLTAMASSWSRRRLLLTVMTVFAVANLIIGWSGEVWPLFAMRLVSGLSHGVFLAVASSAATRLVSPNRAGSAVAVVFGGLTLALAFGVPLGTYLGTIWSWRVIFGLIAASGAIGLAGLALLMPDDGKPKVRVGVWTSIQAIANVRLLSAAAVTVLAYAGSFCLFSYISALLIEITGVEPQRVSIIMLIYGVAAAIGNVVGGAASDRFGASSTVVAVLIWLTIALLGIWWSVDSAWAMAVFVALLGFVTYAAVPCMQARVISIAEHHAPHALAVAAGLNIAGFNSGIAIGSLLGGVLVERIALTAPILVGAGLAALGLILMLAQIRKD
jgi:DHA1 family inner membrane transport protein